MLLYGKIDSIYSFRNTGTKRQTDKNNPQKRKANSQTETQKRERERVSCKILKANTYMNCHAKQNECALRPFYRALHQSQCSCVYSICSVFKTNSCSSVFTITSLLSPSRWFVLFFFTKFGSLLTNQRQTKQKIENNSFG